MSLLKTDGINYMSSVLYQAGQQMVEIASLNPMQLQQLQEQLKSELELFTNSQQQLRIATSKFQESLQSVAKLDGTSDGKSNGTVMTLRQSMWIISSTFPF